jgi:hypothetical protein
MISFQGTHVVTDVILTCVRLWSAKILSLSIPPRRHQFVLPTLPLELGPTRFWTLAFPAATIVRDDHPSPRGVPWP